MSIIVGSYDIPTAIRILLKAINSKKRYQVGLINENLKSLLEKYEINYKLIKSDNLDKINIFDYQAIVLNCKVGEEEEKLIPLLFEKIMNTTTLTSLTSNSYDQFKLLIISNKKKLIENLVTQYKPKCVDYYISHNSHDKEYYICVNF